VKALLRVEGREEQGGLSRRRSAAAASEAGDQLQQFDRISTSWGCLLRCAHDAFGNPRGWSPVDGRREVKVVIFRPRVGGVRRHGVRAEGESRQGIRPPRGAGSGTPARRSSIQRAFFALAMRDVKVTDPETGEKRTPCGSRRPGARPAALVAGSVPRPSPSRRPALRSCSPARN